MCRLNYINIFSTLSLLYFSYVISSFGKIDHFSDKIKFVILPQLFLNLNTLTFVYLIKLILMSFLSKKKKNSSPYYSFRIIHDTLFRTVLRVPWIIISLKLKIIYKTLAPDVPISKIVHQRCIIDHDLGVKQQRIHFEHHFLT